MDNKKRLNKLGPAAQKVGLGDKVYGTEITGTVALSGFVKDAAPEYFTVNHYSTDGVEFVDNPLPEIDAPAGFEVIPINGTNGQRLVCSVVYREDEVVYGDGTGGGGSGTLTWTRRGIKKTSGDPA